MYVKSDLDTIAMRLLVLFLAHLPGEQTSLGIYKSVAVAQLDPPVHKL